MQATLTITGLYEWDNTIFAGWVLPTGVNLETLKNLILHECSGLELTLPEPDIFKMYSASWCLRKAHAWERALAVINAEYNPIHNYDRQERRTQAETGSSGHSGELESTSTEETAAFNASTYAPKGKLKNEQESESSATYGRNALDTVQISGNIGVMSSQDMVNQELDLTPRLDIYHIILQDFKKEFCLQIYY